MLIKFVSLSKPTATRLVVAGIEVGSGHEDNDPHVDDKTSDRTFCGNTLSFLIGTWHFKRTHQVHTIAYIYSTHRCSVDVVANKFKRAALCFALCELMKTVAGGFTESSQSTQVVTVRCSTRHNCPRIKQLV